MALINTLVAIGFTILGIWIGMGFMALMFVAKASEPWPKSTEENNHE